MRSFGRLNGLSRTARKVALNNTTNGLDKFYQITKKIQRIEESIMKKEVNLMEKITRSAKRNSPLRGGQTRRKNRA
jgi:hypothetical protein